MSTSARVPRDNSGRLSDGPQASATALPVVHFVDALGGSDRLWGKENVIANLMHAQRASGALDPELVTFTPGRLSETMRAAGFRVHSVGERSSRVPVAALGTLRDVLSRRAPAVLHTHEYKANIVARIARASGIAMRRLVSTAHGWVDSTPQLEAYFALDRWTARWSDAVTVTDPLMLKRFPPLRPAVLIFIPNAVGAAAPPTAADRISARNRFGFAADAFVIGSLGRLTKNKGILDLLAAAQETRDDGIVWAIAGAGALAQTVIDRACPNVRFVGYQADNGGYLAALDVYVQASYFEGLSLALLEAMRAALPSIASRAGATDFAVRDNVEAVLVPAGSVAELVAAARRLQSDAALRRRLGDAARTRFEDAFSIVRQHEAFLRLYSA